MAAQDPVLNGLEDNIADDHVDHTEQQVPQVAPAEVAKDGVDPADTLMAKFDVVQAGVEKMGVTAIKLDKQPHDQARVEVLIEYVKQLQEQNESMYDLIVEMSNFFGSR
jgi:hypothetical protein